jgi:hypothetical protein
VNANAAGDHSIMSIIIDGMDQSHCKVPYLGTQATFSNPLSQSITGVKVHGHGIILYRTIDTVKKGANLTIYVILASLENWRKEYGKYPDELYIQVDGGSENANQYVLGMLELLVIKRVCRLIYFTRLPTGHTHEDIDACFSIIWGVFRYRPCETLQGYKKLIEDHLSTSKLNAQLVDVMILPNYKNFIENSIDSKISRLHKQSQTQHQWRFQAVRVPNESFIHGCKTSYKAYSSDKIVELVPKPKLQCLSMIGRYTGLEPVTVHCPWMPSAELICTNKLRPGVEGMTLIKQLPTSSSFAPVPFPELGVDNINKCLSDVRVHFQNDPGILAAWNDWASTWAPRTNSVDEYLGQILSSGEDMHQPLKYILLSKSSLSKSDEIWSSSDFLAENRLNSNFEWPAEVIALARNSVTTSENPDPPNPRLTVGTDTTLAANRNYFFQHSSNYYDVELRKCNNLVLQDRLKRRTEISGVMQALSGDNRFLIIYFYIISIYLSYYP